MRSRQRCKSYNGIHRGPDIMGHIIQKCGFCRVCTFRMHQGSLQFMMAFFQFLVQFIRLSGCSFGFCLCNPGFLQDTKYDQQYSQKYTDKQSCHCQQILLYEIQQSNLLGSIIVGRQCTCKFGCRHRLQSLIQDRQKNGISPADCKGYIVRLCQKNTVKLFVIDILCRPA